MTFLSKRSTSMMQILSPTVTVSPTMDLHQTRFLARQLVPVTALVALAVVAVQTILEAVCLGEQGMPGTHVSTMILIMVWCAAGMTCEREFRFLLQPAFSCCMLVAGVCIPPHRSCSRKL